MRVPSTPRRTGARNKPVHFEYVSTEKGQTWEAYKAGPAWWGYLHMSKPSKPCVWELTGGALCCRFCGSGTARVAVLKGWVPLYARAGGAAVMVPVDEAQRDVIDAMKTFTKVVVGRARGKTAGVFVQPCMSQEPVWSSTMEERNRDADITESLLTVWALPEVTTFFARPSDNGLSLTTPPTALTTAVPTAAAPPTAAATGRAVPVDMVNDEYVEIVNRLGAKTGVPKPSSNGHK